LGDAVRRDPRLARGWYYLGEARRISGDDAAALIAYRKAVELEPAYGRALDALARLSDDPASDAK
jgi:cytochrome c-type biogenesis protein CcmH/NrfG